MNPVGQHPAKAGQETVGKLQKERTILRGSVESRQMASFESSARQANHVRLRNCATRIRQRRQIRELRAP